MLERLHPPLPFRLINGAGTALENLGLTPLRFEPERLRAKASRATGLSDFGPGPHEEGLEVLCRSFEEDARLSLIGRIGMQNMVSRALQHLLQRVEAKKRRPDVFEAPLDPAPLIVIGLPRSGTTFLHRLLCQTEGARPLRTFELQHPFPPEGKDRRRQLVDAEFARLKSMAPSLDVKHFLGAEEPEECMWLLNTTLVSLSYWVFAPVHAYLEWYLEQDHHVAYQGYREHLQLFQAETPGRRLTLKAPVHTGHLDALLAAVPEAKLVQTHRDPVPVVGSTNSLIHTIHSVMSEEVDDRRTGRTNLEMLGRMMKKHLEARERHADRILDVDYDALLADPIGTVRRVHEHHGLGWREADEARLQEHLEGRQQHRFGRHEYSLEECGLEAAEVDALFADYRGRFLTKV
ncbi:MAG: sulfotransferase [Deltaproteobacteria bacterium]|nr:sulfotransferase [Deltaproteobacteria bacterium]